MTTSALPVAAGIGLRAPHHARVACEIPAIPWLEVHSENFFAAGGPQLRLLEQLRGHYPLSLHGVGLSLGSADGLDAHHLSQLAALIDRVEPAVVSEHLCWGAIGGVHSNDLLPLPYTTEALALLIDRVGATQDRLGCRILVENVSSYLQYADEAMPEWEFLAQLARASGCGVLLDVNNVYVSARNHRFDARQYIAAMPGDAIGELHLAGHSVETIDGVELRIDTHSNCVCDDVWALYDYTLALFGAKPTLIEWDADIPQLEVLIGEAFKAEKRLHDAQR